MSGWFVDEERSVRQGACPWCLKPIGIPMHIDPPECLRCETCGGTWVMTTLPTSWLRRDGKRAQPDKAELPKELKL